MDELKPLPEPYIICAAVHYPVGYKRKDQPVNINTGYVIAGRRHSNCYQVLEMLGVNIGSCSRSNEGFLTSDNRFLNRKEAALLAKERGQIIHPYSPEELISENLYYP